MILVDTWRRSGHTSGRLTWEVEVGQCSKGRYRTKSEAIAKIATAMGIPKMEVRDEVYTAAKPPGSGWYLAWTVRPLRPINLPRPSDLRFQSHGWLDVHDARKLRRWGLLVGPQKKEPRGQRDGKRGQGRLAHDERKAVEQRALEVALDWCSGQKWEEIEEHRRGPYDITARIPAELRKVFVEVKGTTGSRLEAEVTSGEVRHARQNASRTFLAIVTGIRVVRGRAGPVGLGGSQHIFRCWNPQDEDLRPLTYRWSPAE